MGIVAVMVFQIAVNVGMVRGADAGDGDSAAAAELWRIVGAVYVSGAGDCDEYPDAAVRELIAALRRASDRLAVPRLVRGTPQKMPSTVTMT